jgi:tRNA threonylcarbamoyladenosine biosynthesis protein TsaB
VNDKLGTCFLVICDCDMSCLLAFDTSTQTMSVALWVHGEVLAFDGEGGAAASTHLIARCHSLLAQAGVSLSTLDAIAFGRGPGAFTGLRTACAVAQGLALGADKPVLALDSLLVVAQDACVSQGALAQHNERPIWVVNDARMGEVYAAQYRFVLASKDWHQITAPFLSRPDALCEHWASDPPGAIAGNALLALPAAFDQAFQQSLPLQTASKFPQAQVRAQALALQAELAWRRGDAMDVALALPLYVRDKVAQTTAERQAAHKAGAAEHLT